MLGRRADGYHDLDTLAVFAAIGDRLAAAPADILSLRIDGPFAGHAPADDRNLVLRAARALAAETGAGRGAALLLTKHLPGGAGLGGGSADAAAALVLLNDLWGARLDAAALARLGLSLGADVPMCLAGRALRARGVGERIVPVGGVPPLPLVLAWPGRPVATASVFNRLRRRSNIPLPVLPERFDSVEQVAAWLAHARNDLDSPAIKVEPSIATCLNALRAQSNCRVARMTGSGSACFGLFLTEAKAEAAATALRVSQPDWWVTATIAHHAENIPQ